MSIHRFDEVTSTNDKARELITAGEPGGTVIVARTQTAGRGRSGRAWHSPNDDNLYLSYIHRTHLDPRSCAGMTIDVGVVLAELLTRKGLDVELKWPNDVLIHGLKVAGILCELVTDQGSPVVIVGIGLNINGSDFPEELKTIATSLFNASHEPHDSAAIETELIRDLSHALTRYDARSRPDTEGYRRHFRMIGRRVILTGGSSAEVEGISNNGGLMVRTNEGSQVLRSGEVKFVSVQS
jgi:BirA family biotin operon repressor/biotin-[acetyl-CoA-carboxylase] ligase